MYVHVDLLHKLNFLWQNENKMNFLLPVYSYHQLEKGNYMTTQTIFCISKNTNKIAINMRNLFIIIVFVSSFAIDLIYFSLLKCEVTLFRTQIIIFCFSVHWVAGSLVINICTIKRIEKKLSEKKSVQNGSTANTKRQLNTRISKRNLE